MGTGEGPNEQERAVGGQGESGSEGMSERGVFLDLEDLCPPAREVVGLQFSSDEEFARCVSLLLEDLDYYRAINRWDRFVVVRKTDLHRFEEAGLVYTTVELREPDENPTEEARERRRARMKRYMALWLKELGWDK